MGMMVGTGTAAMRTNPYGSRTGGNTGAGDVRKTTGQKKKKRKRLNYNYRDVSGRILRAKTSVSARMVVVHARTVTAMLRRRQGCGEYDDRDLELAIIHAEKMVRIAKKKLKNLKSEEQAERGSKAAKTTEEYEEENTVGMEEAESEEGKISEEELRQMIRQMEQELQELAQENALDDLTDEFLGGGEMSEEELAAFRKKHRCDEMRQIVEADMKYLKAMFQHMMQEQQEIAAAVTLELSEAAINTPINVSLAAASGMPAAEGVSVDAAV